MSENKSIQLEQAKILYKQSLILFGTILLLIFIVMFFFRGHQHYNLLIIWAFVVFILTMARVVLVKAFHRQLSIDNPRRWLNAFAGSAFLSGVTWGVMLVNVLQPSLNSEILVISFILTGMVAGSLVPLSCYIPAFAAFAIPTLVPFSLYLLAQPDQATNLSGMLVILYLVALMGFAVMVNRNIIDSIQLRFANVDLLNDLQIQKELAEKANIDKSRFLAATSHDLRQPLHALDLYLGALQLQLEKPSDTELLDKASASSQALSELLNALMDISKLDSGAVQINAKIFSLTQLLSTICSEYEQQAKEKSITIEVQLDEVTVNTDPVLLGRMLRNLIVNAVTHNKNCMLKVSTSLDNGNVQIDIKDSGQGIAVAELENIFSEFYQLNNPERDRTKGLGLGLAIVKRLSLLLAIPVEVKSTLGRGTQFSLHLPITSDELIELDINANSAVVDLAGLFIIVIDDESAVRDAVKSLLRAWGCEVLLASSQTELMEILKQDNYPLPDIIISDYRLRDNKTGVEAIAAVRKYFKEMLPALIITGDSSSTIAIEIAAKKCRLLLKPVNSQTLRTEIEGLISKA
ncbi:MAG: hypothetical protein COA83_05650 [Methylophaga sp.]|nr:MAG: hypothetical protein COA83_05650 [Methylophaga sp.]